MSASPSNEPVTGVRLAVDVGRARVGLAATDPAGIMATPVATLRRDNEKQRDMRKIVSEARQRNATRVYVGEPRNLHGENTASTEDAYFFADQLRQHFSRAGENIDVRMIDERLSTSSASKAMSLMGRNTKSQRSVIDQAAAVEILEHALDMEKIHGVNTGTLVCDEFSSNSEPREGE